MKKININFLIYAGIVLFFIIVLHQDMTRLNSLSRQNAKIKNAILFETKSQKLLARKIKELTENDMIELVARQKLGLIKYGETAYKIVYN